MVESIILEDAKYHWDSDERLGTVKPFWKMETKYEEA